MGETVGILGNKFVWTIFSLFCLFVFVLPWAKFLNNLKDDPVVRQWGI